MEFMQRKDVFAVLPTGCGKSLLHSMHNRKEVSSHLFTGNPKTADNLDIMFSFFALSPSNKFSLPYPFVSKLKLQI